MSSELDKQQQPINPMDLQAMGITMRMNIEQIKNIKELISWIFETASKYEVSITEIESKFIKYYELINRNERNSSFM